ncbi:MAG TPA: aldo/keto reductase [Cyclobacteriaceae bacterium]|nr:aldo/keto reductase [Cyclobacteriaceae bacterium]
MQYKKLGNSDIMVSPIAFGGNVFGWTLKEKGSFRMLDAFLDGGFNFIDTADTYSKWAQGNSGGESETIIGKWLQNRGKREDVVIATKLGGEMDERQKGLSANYIKKAVESSLWRLRTDYIDLYQSHYDDPNTPVEETMTAFDQLIKEGKVRLIGASNLSAERISQSNQFAGENNLSRYQTLQPLYNLYDRERFEKDYQPLIEEEGLAVLSYYSLASGFLSGKYQDPEDLKVGKRGKDVKKYMNERGFRILKALDLAARQNNVPMARVAIAWLLHKPYITAPIASATSDDQLRDLMAAASLQLSSAQVEALDKASAY